MLFHPLSVLIELTALVALYLTVIGNIAFLILMLQGTPKPPFLIIQTLASSVFTFGILALLNGWWVITHTPQMAWNFGMVLLIGLQLIRVFQLPMRQT